MISFCILFLSWRDTSAIMAPLQRENVFETQGLPTIQTNLLISILSTTTLSPFGLIEKLNRKEIQEDGVFTTTFGSIMGWEHGVIRADQLPRGH